MISISFVINDGEYLTHFRDVSVEYVGLNKKERRMAILQMHTSVFKLSSAWLLGIYVCLADQKGIQSGGLSLSTAYIAPSTTSLHRESTDSLIMQDIRQISEPEG